MDRGSRGVVTGVVRGVVRGVGPMGRSRGVGQPGPNAAGVSYRRKAKDSGGVTVGLLMVTEYDRRVATVQPYACGGVGVAKRETDLHTTT